MIVIDLKRMDRWRSLENGALDVEAGHMGLPLEEELDRGARHARAFSVVDPLLHRGRMGRGAFRGAVLRQGTARSRIWSSRSSA